MPILDEKIRLIRQIASDLTVHTAATYHSGQFNQTVLINDEWIFRFPRYQEEAERMVNEVKLLRGLKGRLPVAIPDPVYAVLDLTENGKSLMGYRLLPGIPLAGRVNLILTEADRERIAGQLAGFLRTLHSIPAGEVGLTSEMQDDWSAWENLRDQVREKLFPIMRSEARKPVDDIFRNRLEEISGVDVPRCLRHGDFGGSNILIDLEPGEITGVIDFSSAAVGDPAVDLASVWTVDDRLFQQITVFYEPDEVKRSALVKRAGLIRKTYGLMEALDGFNLGDKGALDSGLKAFI